MSDCLTEQEQLLQQYKEQGYALFEGVYDEASIAAWRDEADRLEDAHDGLFSQKRNWWFGNMLERAPALMWPAVANPLIVDFIERIVGPFVQLDNLTLAAFPPLSKEEAADKVSGWHRDRWGHFPTGVYQRPLALNAICYLQDLSAEYGPLRVIDNSHIQPIAMDEEEREAPHRDEKILHLKAGDVVLTHNGLLHSGTPNISGKKRYFFSIYYNISWLKHTDTFGGPNCLQLIEWARQRNDHRALRLLGADEQLQGRCNSGFQEPDEGRWQQWMAADQEALSEEAG